MQYAIALTWIREIGLLNTIGSPTPPALRVLGAIFERGGLPWVRDADALVQSPDELPTDMLAAGKALDLGPDDIYGQLLTSWGKVDTETRERVGAAGETALLELLRATTNARVEQVSAWSDSFGYDLALSSDTLQAHLEVKSTTRQGRLTIYLSRNEHDVMLRDETWFLVTVRLSENLTIEGTGMVPKSWIAQNTPRDIGSAGRWASCKLEIPRHVIADGVPLISTALAHPLPAW